MKKNTKIAVAVCIAVLAVLVFYFGIPRATVIITSFNATPNAVSIGDTLYVSYTLFNDLSTPQNAFDMIVLDNDDNPSSWCGYLYVPDTPITIPAQGSYQGSHTFTVEESWLNHCLYDGDSFKLVLDVQYVGGNDAVGYFIVQYIPPAPPPTYSVNVYTNPNGCMVTLDGTITQVSQSNTVFTDVPAGEHTLETSKTGYITDNRTITVISNTEVLVTLQEGPSLPQLEINAANQVKTGVDFQIQVKADNVPVPNARLMLQWDQNPVYTDNSGNAIITAPIVTEDTIYSIVANKTGYADDVFPITITVNDPWPVPGFEAALFFIALFSAILVYIIYARKKNA